jgi:FMN phosphatase YigB (HAD superfamily)
MAGGDVTLRAVFVDLFGTLMDPESDRMAHRAMVRSMAERFGLEGEELELTASFEAAREGYFARPEGWTAREVIIEATAGWVATHGGRVDGGDEAWLREVYLSTHLQQLRLYPDAEGFLQGLAHMPFHRGLISDIDVEFLGLVRKALNLDEFLQSYTCSEEVQATKPSPKPFLAALAKVGCRPEEAIHIGDLPHKDVAGARAVGMRTMLRRGTVDEGEADYVVDDLTQALPILQALLEEGG